MKQTAVEYLFEQLWETPKDKLTWNALLEQAKEMEKQQIIDAWNGDVTFIFNNIEQYYIDTYGE